MTVNRHSVKVLFELSPVIHFPIWLEFEFSIEGGGSVSYFKWHRSWHSISPFQWRMVFVGSRWSWQPSQNFLNSPLSVFLRNSSSAAAAEDPPTGARIGPEAEGEWMSEWLAVVNQGRSLMRQARRNSSRIAITQDGKTGFERTECIYCPNPDGPKTPKLTLLGNTCICSRVCWLADLEYRPRPWLWSGGWAEGGSRWRAGRRSEVLALKHESWIIGPSSNPVSCSRKSQASSPWAKQHRV